VKFKPKIDRTLCRPGLSARHFPWKSLSDTISENWLTNVKFYHLLVQL